MATSSGTFTKHITLNGRLHSWAKRLSVLTLGLLLFSAIGLVLLGLQFKQISYTALIDGVLKNLQRPDLKAKLTQSFFTAHKFNTIQALIYPAILVLLGLIVLLVWKRKTILVAKQKLYAGALTRLFNAAELIKALPVKQKLLLAAIMLGFLARSLYLASTFYIQYDEAFNYNYFLQKNIAYSIVAYNNYPLHNIVSGLLMKVFSADLQIQRLASVICGALFVLLTFLCCEKIWAKRYLSFTLMLIAACMPVTVYYSLYARGVLLNMVFASILYFYLYRWYGRLNAKRVIGLALLNALALYSMVSHLYFIGLSGLFLLAANLFQGQYKQVGYALLYLIASILFGSLLFLPMQLGSGIHLGLNAAHASTALSLATIVKYCDAVTYFISGIRYTFWILVVFNLALLALGSSVQKKLAALHLCLLGICFIIPYTTHVMPPERALSYVALPLMGSLAAAIDMIMQKSKPYFAIAGGLILAIVMQVLALRSNFINWSKPLDKSAYDLAQIMLNKNIPGCYNQSKEFEYYAPALNYYYLRQNKNFQYYSNNPSSTRYRAMHAQEPCLVIDANDQQKQEIKKAYTLLYAFHEFEVYVKQ